MISVKHSVSDTPVASAQSKSAVAGRHDIALLPIINTRQTDKSGAQAHSASLYCQTFSNTARQLSSAALPVITAIVLTVWLNVHPASAQTDALGDSGGNTDGENTGTTGSPDAALTDPINVAFLEFLGLVTELDDVGLTTDATTDNIAADTATPKTK